MNINQDIDKSQWWMINKLKREGILFNSNSLTIDVQEKNDKYSRKQQQKLLNQLTHLGVIKCSPIRTNLDDYAVTSGQQDQWDTRNYNVSLVQPEFDSLYSKMEKTHPYIQLEHIDRSVSYRAATIKQGYVQHTFKDSPELVSILSLLWPKRRIVIDKIVKRDPTPFDMNGLLNSLLDSAPNLTGERVADICDAFNKTMKRKHISASIKRSGGIILAVDESTGQ